MSELSLSFMNFSVCLFTPDSSLLPSLCLSFPSHLPICLSAVCLTTRLLICCFRRHLLVGFHARPLRLFSCTSSRPASRLSRLQSACLPVYLSASLPPSLPPCLPTFVCSSVCCLFDSCFFLPRSECVSFECEPLLLPRGPRSTERLTWL